MTGGSNTGSGASALSSNTIAAPSFLPVNRSPLHYKAHILHHLDVVQRVPRNRHQVGALADRDHTAVVDAQETAA